MFLFQALPLPLPHCLTLHSAWSEPYDDSGHALLPSSIHVSAGWILILTLVLLFLLSLGGGFGGRKRSSLSAPPGPHKWALPILGDLPYLMVMAKRLPLHQALYEMSKQYGPLMELRLGTSQRILVASSPSVARLILQTHDNIFSSRAPNIVTSILFGSPSSDISFSDPGPQWKLLRRICINQLVAPKSLLAFRPLIHEEVRSMISSILDDATSSHDDNDNKNLVIRYRIQKCNNNIISRMVIGKTMDEKTIELLIQIAHLIGEMNIGDFFPALAWMDLQGYGRRTKDVFLKFQNHVNEIISERRDEMANSTSPLKVDLLNMFLSIKDEDVEITDNIIRSSLMNIISGGTDTTSGTIEWALAELLANPNKMELLQSELRRVIGNTKCVEISDLPNLPYLSAVVKETMRMHPVVPLLVPHKLTHSCELLGYEILAGTQVYVNVWAISHDPSVWENPLLFCPERFLDSKLPNEHGVNWNFLPFGSGRRSCPGSTLAIMNVELILASLLHSFEWKACGEPKLNESFGIIVHMDTPLVVKAYPRLPLQMY